MEVITKKVYQANDGKLFESEKECLDYEKWLAEKDKYISYWKVIHQPDTTEGRGHSGLTYLVVDCKSHELENLVVDYCFRTFGRKIDFVQGVAEIFNWNLYSIKDKEDFNKRSSTIRFGDYTYNSTVRYLVLGFGVTGLIEKQG